MNEELRKLLPTSQGSPTTINWGTDRAISINCWFTSGVSLTDSLVSCIATKAKSALEDGMEERFAINQAYDSELITSDFINEETTIPTQTKHCLGFIFQIPDSNMIYWIECKKL